MGVRGRRGVSPRLGACGPVPAAGRRYRLVLRGHPPPSPHPHRAAPAHPGRGESGPFGPSRAEPGPPPPSSLAGSGRLLRSGAVGRGHCGGSPQDEARPRPYVRAKAARAEPRRAPGGTPPHPTPPPTPKPPPHHQAPPAIEARPPGRTRKTSAPPHPTPPTTRPTPPRRPNPAPPAIEARPPARRRKTPHRPARATAPPGQGNGSGPPPPEGRGGPGVGCVRPCGGGTSGTGTRP